MIHQTQIDRLKVEIYETRLIMGQKAADALADRINALLALKETVNIIFAAAPSQNEFLAALLRKELDWKRIRAFHMDEYVGLKEDAPQAFGNFLKRRLFGKVSFREVYYLNGNAPDLPKECERYADLLRKYPADIVCMGIGENTHIAFNDPHEADFNDPQLVKIVTLDKACRQQQVNDGCFKSITEVPVHALTLTVPALMQAEAIFCMVPGANKAQAVYHTLKSSISEQYPSSVLRRHPKAILYLDRDSAEKIIEYVTSINAF